MMIDFGVMFGNGNLPGIDLVLPDTRFIEERRDRLVGLVLTHAHEDHIGAVPYLWDRLRCPVYGTPFTLSILRRKLLEDGRCTDVPLEPVPPSGRFRVGPFDLEMVVLTHSIPEPNAIALHTPVGTVLHTGDWKLDPNPVIGPKAEMGTLRRLGDEGVLAIVCDSTNVFESGTSGSESELLESLTGVIASCEHRVAVGCFASNVARLETISAAATANGRDVVLAGRSLRRIDEAARENGYLADTRAFLPEDAARHLPKDKVLILCTGSQGESRAALARIAEGSHPRVFLEGGDTVIFSSRVIPGNELAIARVQNLLTRRGIHIVTQKDSFVHVSGHPARDEMAAMYRLVRPQICIPVHGEARHLSENADLARRCGVTETHVVENGAILRIGPGPAGLVGDAPVGRLSVEGDHVVRLDEDGLRRRNNLMFNGSVVATIVLDQDGHLVSDPQFSVVGILDRDKGHDAAMDEVRKALADLGQTERGDDQSVREAVRLSVRRAFRKALGKKPVTEVHLFRLTPSQYAR
jgi:ribonuclease J